MVWESQMRHLRSLFLAALLFVFSINLDRSRAAEFRVDGPSSNPNAQIQAKIDRAVDGDVIVVADGIYTQPGNRGLNFRGKAITLRSEGGPEKCIIGCQGTDRAFCFTSGEGPDTVIEGFTITNGWSEYGGGAIFCYNDSNPTIRNCILLANATAFFGGAIRCHASSPTIVNCVFAGNSAGLHGGALYAGGQVRETAHGNLVTSDPALFSCLFISNIAEQFGGAMHFADGASPLVRNLTVCRNVAGLGGGITCSGRNGTASTRLDVANSIVWTNRSEWITPGAGTQVFQVPISATTVSGHVRDSDGEPLADATIRVPGSPLSSMKTDSYGYYEVHTRFAIRGIETTPDCTGQEILLADSSSVAEISSCLIGGGRSHIYWHGGELPQEWWHDELGLNAYPNSQDPNAHFAKCRSGTWTSKWVFLDWGASKLVVFMDSNARMHPDEHAGKFLQPDTSRSAQLYIWSNTEKAIICVPDSRQAEEMAWANAGDTYRIWDYHLGNNSSCIDAGDNALVGNADETDIDGDQRVLFGRCDIGCDEVSSDPPPDGVLPKLRKNRVVIVFGDPNALARMPQDKPVTITPLCGGEDVALTQDWAFRAARSQANGALDTLVCEEVGEHQGFGVLKNRTWYRLEPVASWDVEYFRLDFRVLHGDVNQDGRVLSGDYAAVAANDGLACGFCLEDLDGNGWVSKQDDGYVVIARHGNELSLQGKYECPDQDVELDGEGEGPPAEATQAARAAESGSALDGREEGPAHRGCGSGANTGQLGLLWVASALGLLALKRRHGNRSGW